MYNSVFDYNYLSKTLEYKFLYQNDIDSMHILLSVLENKYEFFNLKPKYSLLKRISYGLYRSLSYRQDRDYILHTIQKLVNDEINRLELAINIEAYLKGFYSSDCVNLVERTALDIFDSYTLSNRKKLFHRLKDFRKVIEGEKIYKLKSDIFSYLESNPEIFVNLERLSRYFCDENLKKKIFNINEYLSSQLVIDEKNLSELKLEEKMLTVYELNKIYNKFSIYLIKYIHEIYKNNFWYGVNDGVLKRYQ